jgi:hypothetical protein
MHLVEKGPRSQEIVEGWEAILKAVRDVPSYVVAPVFTFLGMVITVWFGPRVLWTVEKKRELRKHHRDLIAQWHKMVSDVSEELDRLEEAGTPYTLGDVLRILERHPAYPSFMSTSERYTRSGMRGIKLRFSRSWIGPKLRARRKPRFSATPERIMVAGSHLPARLHVTIEQITKIERWWRL